LTVELSERARENLRRNDANNRVSMSNHNLEKKSYYISMLKRLNQ